MSYSTSRKPADPRAYFRCPVIGKKGKASLRVGWTNIPTTVIDASIGGYTITVDAKYAKKLARSRRDWTISYDDTKARVRRETVARPEQGLVRVGLVQLKDLTKPEVIKSSLWSRFRLSADSGTATIAYGGFVLFLFLAMALPGLGDQLGTSDRIQDTFRWVFNNASQQVDLWTR